MMHGGTLTGESSASSASGVGELLGVAMSARDWAADGSFRWVGDPVDNNPMLVIVIDHALYPAVVFDMWMGMSQDTSPALQPIEFNIYCETDSRVIDYRQTVMPSTQWRGAPVSPIHYRHPKGVAGGECEYQLQIKCNDSPTLIGGRADTGARSEYVQSFGFAARAA